MINSLTVNPIIEILSNIFGGRTKKMLDNMQAVMDAQQNRLERADNKLDRLEEKVDLLTESLEKMRDNANSEAMYRCEVLDCPLRQPPLDLNPKY